MFKFFSPLDLAVNLSGDPRHISYHTCNLSLHYLVKNIKNRKKNSNVCNTISLFCLIIEKINQINFVYTRVTLNAKISCLGMDACIETLNFCDTYQFTTPVN